MIKVILKKKSRPKTDLPLAEFAPQIKLPESGPELENESQLPKSVLAEFLYEARKSKGLTPVRLSELTHIPLWHLKALEEGDYKKLPPEVYLKGVFFRLAKFLEISPKDILKKYKEDNPVPKIIDLPIERPRSHYFNFGIITPKKIAILASALFLVLLFSYLWYQYDIFTGPPTLVLVNPKEDIEVASQELKVQGQTGSDVYLTINGQNVYVNQDGVFSSSISLTSGINAIEILAKNRLGKESKVLRQVFYKANQTSTSTKNLQIK